MAVTAPTASSIKIRFPEFAGVADATIEFIIAEAVQVVGDTWDIQQDLAVMYLVAHHVSCSIAAAASGGTGSDGTIVSESIGRLSRTYARAAASDASQSSTLKSTSYGKRFLEIQRGNFPGPVIA